MVVHKIRYVLGILLLLAVMGCNSNLLEPMADDSSHEAKVEEARIALNDGEYQRAINILEPGYEASDADPEVSRILASAYMGLAGIDLSYIIENSGQDDSSSFDVIASALHLDLVSSPEEATAPASVESVSASPRYIDRSSIDAFISSLETSQTYIAALVASGNADDDVVQLGMASAVHFIMEVGLTAANTADINNIPINKAAYQATFPSDGDWSGLLDDLADTVDGDSALLASLIGDLTSVQNTVTVLTENAGADEDITEKFNQFMTELLGSGNPADLTGTIIYTYISTYLLEYEG